MVTARISAAVEGLDGPQRDDLNLAECVVLMSASAFFTGLSPQELSLIHIWQWTTIRRRIRLLPPQRWPAYDEQKSRLSD